MIEILVGAGVGVVGWIGAVVLLLLWVKARRRTKLLRKQLHYRDTIIREVLEPEEVRVG